jgi:hypothetical protein
MFPALRQSVTWRLTERDAGSGPESVVAAPRSANCSTLNRPPLYAQSSKTSLDEETARSRLPLDRTLDKVARRTAAPGSTAPGARWRSMPPQRRLGPNGTRAEPDNEAGHYAVSTADDPQPKLAKPRQPPDP